MIASAENKYYQSLLKKGNGSILKAIRADKGAGRGLIAGGIVLLGFAVMLGLPCVFFAASRLAGLGLFGLMLLPGILMIILGIILKNKREANWLSYYQKEYGYTEEDLLQADKELSSDSVKLVLCRAVNATIEAFVYGFITENYVLINGVYPYLKKLDDVIAVAFSDSTLQWCMVCITKQDKDVMAIPLHTDTDRKPLLCQEVMQEMCRSNPNILCGQQIVCEDKFYILEKDGAELIRLYNEGRKLEVVK
ncbi:MAG: hypothetical protein J6A94_08535 [Lachnospiraceae bacterium]|nr:hypothetical protein [Lachnospiraceae bacterium]